MSRHLLTLLSRRMAPAWYLDANYGLYLIDEGSGNPQDTGGSGNHLTRGGLGQLPAWVTGPVGLQWHASVTTYLSQAAAYPNISTAGMVLSWCAKTDTSQSANELGWLQIASVLRTGTLHVKIRDFASGTMRLNMGGAGGGVADFTPLGGVRNNSYYFYWQLEYSVAAQRARMWCNNNLVGTVTSVAPPTLPGSPAAATWAFGLGDVNKSAYSAIVPLLKVDVAPYPTTASQVDDWLVAKAYLETPVLEGGKGITLPIWNGSAWALPV